MDELTIHKILLNPFDEAYENKFMERLLTETINNGLMSLNSDKSKSFVGAALQELWNSKYLDLNQLPL